MADKKNNTENKPKPTDKSLLSHQLGKASLLEHFWDHTEDNMFIVHLGDDGDFVIDDFNPAQVKAIGIPMEEMLNKKLKAVVGDELAKQLEGKYLNCLRVKKPVSYYEGYPYNGTLIYYNTLLIPIFEEDGTQRVFGQSRELTELVSAKQDLEDLNRKLETTVEVRTQELEESNEQLKLQALTDQLTGVGNRRHFFESIEQILPSLNPEIDSSLLYLDLDYFKAVNDEHGHSVGDQVLIKFARQLKYTIRESDILCRFGGEEFVIFMPHTDKRGALEVARKILRAVSSTPYLVQNKPLSITTSIGVSSLNSTMDSIDKLIFNADKALYHAKRNGRNRVEQF